MADETETDRALCITHSNHLDFNFNFFKAVIKLVPKSDTSSTCRH